MGFYLSSPGLNSLIAQLPRHKGRFENQHLRVLSLQSINLDHRVLGSSHQLDTAETVLMSLIWSLHTHATRPKQQVGKSDLC